VGAVLVLGFGLLVSSMSMFGLIETGSGDIRYTQLGEIVLHGEPDEIANAKERAVRNIRVLADIFDKFGPNPTEEQIRIFLREKAFVEVSEASNLANAIGKLFKNCVQYLRPSKEGEKRPLMGGERMDNEIATYQLRTPDYGDIIIKDEISADFAAKVIEQFKAKLRATQTSTATTQEENVES
jgi:hypothetical protein